MDELGEKMWPASLLAALVFLRRLTQMSVNNLIFSPGSRSAPLAYAAAALESAYAQLYSGGNTEVSSSNEKTNSANTRPKLHVEVCIDERVNGFLALGMARGQEILHPSDLIVPAACITTSGSAPAHLHPAVLEADAANLPMLIISADRPAELQNVRANQTTEQTRLFGSSLRAFYQIAADSPLRYASQIAQRAFATSTGLLGGRPGPVQVNFGFRDPLAPSSHEDFDLFVQMVKMWLNQTSAPQDPKLERAQSSNNSVQTGDFTSAQLYRCQQAIGELQKIPAHFAVSAANQEIAKEATSNLAKITSLPLWWGKTAVVAGSRAKVDEPGLAAFCEHFSLPLLAEPGAGVRDGQTAVPGYRALLANKEAAILQARTVVVVGHPTLSRPIAKFLQDPARRILVVSPHDNWVDVAGNASGVYPSLANLIAENLHDTWHCVAVEGSSSTPPVAENMAAAQTQESWCRDVLAEGEALHGKYKAALADKLSDSIPALAVQAAAYCQENQRPLLVAASSLVRDLDLLSPQLSCAYTNRGLAGIDGTLACAQGMNLASGQPMIVIIGDVAFVHDLASLVKNTSSMPRDLDIILADDAGGTIFSSIEHGSCLPPDVYSKYFLTTAQLDLPDLAKSLGVQYAPVATRAQLEATLKTPKTAEIRIIHIKKETAETVAARRKLNEISF